MGLKVTIDDKALMAGLDALERGAGYTTQAAARAYASDVVGRILEAWPRDTNRSARGFEEANNSAGLDPLPLSPISRSRIAEKLEKKLKQNYAYWRRRVTAQENQAKQRGVDPSRWPSHRRALKRLAAAAKALEDFAASQGSALVLGLKQDIGDRQIGVRLKVYGGYGTVIGNGARAIVVLVNREPHARFIEMRRRIVQHALAVSAVATELDVRDELIRPAPTHWKRVAA